MSTSRIQQAYDYIQQCILDGTLRAGSVVSEASLARQLGISRTPVGAAIRQLANEGLVEQVPRYGTIVRLPTRDDILELYELREAIEGFAAAKAADRISAEALIQLDRYCRIFEELTEELRSQGGAKLDAAQTRRFLTADLAFHLSIVQAAGNGRMMRIVHTSQIIGQVFRMPGRPHDLPVLEAAHRFHVGVCEALRSRDGQAARETMIAHIRVGMQERLEVHDQIVAEAQQLSEKLTLPANLQAELDQINRQFSPDDSEAPRPSGPWEG
jgi:DNA-binding GntR family transcriptional regulator